jgi:hypothetical protein
MAVLPQRFGKYGLTVHPDTHYWGRSRKGTWVLKRQTAASRFTRALRTITQWCRLHRHEPISRQHQTLSQKLRGHFAYYGITGN